MHDVQIKIRCQRCGHQMELKDPGPDDAWTPQQFWECKECGRHFWTTYPPPKKPVPPKAAKPAPPESGVSAPQAKPVASEAKFGASAPPTPPKTTPGSSSEKQTESAAEKAQ